MHPGILAHPLGAIDTHVHSRHSADSAADPAEVVQAARAAGLRAVVFTEHMEFDSRDPGYGCYDAVEARDDLERLRAAALDLALYRGVEITYYPEREPEIRAYLDAHAFDYALGSIHVVDRLDVSIDMEDPGFFTGRDQRQAYGRYLEEVLRLAECGLFDGLGHLDLCKRYGHRRYGPLDPEAFRPQLDAILHAVLRRGLVLEVNTSGLRQDPGEPYPSPAVARDYLALGGRRLALGSDAHRAADVGFGFKALAASLGTTGCG